MARIRTIKPDFFRHEQLFEAEKESGLPLRIAFAGLWTCADREGRFEWRPRALKLDCLPYDDVDFSRVLDALTTRGFIQKYVINGVDLGCIPSWNKHQVINNRESASVLPALDSTLKDSSTSTREARVNVEKTTRHGSFQGEGEGERKGKGREETAPAPGSAVADPALLSPVEHPLEFPLPVAVVSIPTNVGDEFPIYQPMVEEFERAYPAVDVLAQLRAMRAWSVSNPTNRKTKAGMLRFVNGWLSKEQNRPPSVRSQTARAAPPKTFDQQDYLTGFRGERLAAGGSK